MRDKVLSLGEAVIDVVNRSGHEEEFVGGSPLNVGVGMARLGIPTEIGAWWAQDARGARLARFALSAGASIVPGTDKSAKTPVALATIDENGRATYALDVPWDVPSGLDLSRYRHVHTGSVAATVEPGGTKVVEAVRRIRDVATVSYDPNIRPALMHSPDEVRDRIEDLVALSDVVKASDEDLAWLYGDEPVEDVMRRWLASGPAMVVVTRGPWGAYAMLAGNRDMLHIDQLDIAVEDTVGAGDSFMAGLITGLLEAGLLGSIDSRDRLRSATWADVQPALHTAVITSGITVSRAGAYAPAPAEVRDVRDRIPALA